MRRDKGQPSQERKLSLAALPFVVCLMVFLLGPVVFIFIISFQEKGVWSGISFAWHLENYRRVMDPLYLKVFISSLWLAVLTSFSCLVLGYPMAWFIARCVPSVKRVLLILVMLPFMSNFVVRAYAVNFLIGVEGPLNHMLLKLGLISEPFLMYDPWVAIWFGMVTNYLPFMVLPLFVVFDRFDLFILEAAKDLGASAWQIWWSVLWPLTRRVVGTGVMLVFVPAMGEFVIPDLMGGGRTMYLGNLLADQFLKARDWPFGAAICVSAVMLVALGYVTTMTLLRYGHHLQRRRQE